MESVRARPRGRPARVAALVVLGACVLVASDGMTACMRAAESATPALPAAPRAGVLAVPARTALAVACTDGAVYATANATVPRAALSTAKLYLAEHVLAGPAAEADELALVERMITRSDDDAADILDARYPGAIDRVAERYDLTGTIGMGYWGASLTTAADLVVFVQRAAGTEAGREVLALMSATEHVAADGEVQDWGIAQVPGVTGMKFGWSDQGEPTVASVGFGEGLIVAGSTIGSREQHTTDLAAALDGLCGNVVE